MEFKLNKIDTELRQKVNDMTKEGKVHSKNGIAVNKNKNSIDSEKKGFTEFYKKEKEKEKSNREKICIEATKTEMVEIKAEKKEEDVINPTGVFLDIRK